MPEYLSAANGGEPRLKLSVTQTSSDLATNTSQVLVSLTLLSDYAPKDFKLIARVMVGEHRLAYNSRPYASGYSANLTLIHQTVTIKHREDGQQTILLEVEGTSTFTGPNATLSNGTLTISRQSWVLERIARSSQLAPVSGVLGQAVSLTVTPASPSFRHTLRYRAGNQSGTIASQVVTTTSWTPPLRLANVAPESSQVTGEVLVDTYEGNLLLGTRAVPFTMTIPDNLLPSPGSLSLSDAYATAQSLLAPTDFLRVLSNIKPSLSGAFGSYGSRVVSYQFELVNREGHKTGLATTTNGGELGLMDFTGVYKVRAWVVDSRGRASPVREREVTILDYTPPAVSILPQRTGADEQRLVISRTAKVASVRSGGREVNSLSLSYRVRQLPDGEWKVATGRAVETNSPVLNLDKSEAGLDGSYTHNQSYTVEVTIRDRFAPNPQVAVAHVGTIVVAHSYSKDNFGFGRLPTLTQAVDSEWPYYYRGKALQHHQLTWHDGSAVVASGDWNNYRTSGFYRGDNLANQPPAGNGQHSWKYVRVSHHDQAWCVQEAIDFNGKCAWMRTYAHYNWTPWIAPGLNQFYPVGSIFQSTSPTNPAELMGGTWERFGNGRVLVGVNESDGDFNAPNKAGGTKAHKHDKGTLVAKIGSNTTNGNSSIGFHQDLSGREGNPTHSYMTLGGGASSGQRPLTANTAITGKTSEVSHLPPYLTIYRWRRTA